MKENYIAYVDACIVSSKACVRRHLNAGLTEAEWIARGVLRSLKHALHVGVKNPRRVANRYIKALRYRGRQDVTCLLKDRMLALLEEEK